MGARSVAVVMSWGGDDPKERRRAILNFKRLEYLVRNKCKVKSAGAACPSGEHAGPSPLRRRPRAGPRLHFRPSRLL
jgi:hypothetical protein